MSGNVDGQIDAELNGMSTDELKSALFELLKKNEARKASYNTPQAKARRKEYYEAKKNTPEWKEARARQANQRKAKIEALIRVAKERGIDLKELGF